MKTKITRWLSIMALCAMTVALNGQTLVLSEDFENNALPAGWTQSGSVWQFADSKAVFKTDKSLTDQLVLPQVDLTTPVAETQLLLTYASLPYANTSLADTLQIQWRVAGASEWTLLRELSDAQASTTILLSLPNEAQGKAIEIALKAIPAFAGGIEIDKLEVQNILIANCDYIPQFEEVTDITSTSANLSWVAPDADNIEYYSLKVSTTELTDPENQTADVFESATLETADFSFADEGVILSANTTYYVYLQFVCTEGIGGPWASQQFTTSCAIISGEMLQEDFEDQLSSCWTIVMEGSSDAAEISTAYAYEGSSSFLLKTSSGKFAYLYLPELTGSLSDYQLSFFAATDDGTTGRSLTIGASASADGVDFKEGPSYSLPSAHKWVKITCLLKSLEGKGQYVAFRAGDDNSANKIYIDNVSLEPAQECLAPIFVQTSEVADKSVRLSWTESAGANAWNVLVSPTAWTEAELANEDLVAESDYLYEATENPFIVTGLTPSTTYYVYVNSSCSGSLLWSDVCTFKTAKEVTFPFTEMFDRFDAEFYTDDRYAVPLGWIVGGRTTTDDAEYSYNNDKNYGAYAYVSTAQDAGESNYVSASLLLKGTNSYSAYAIMPAMPASAPALNQCLLEFYVHSSTIDGKIVVGVCKEQTWNVAKGKMFGTVADANFVPVDTITLNADAQSGWQYVAVNLEKYEGSNKYLAFRTLPITSTFTPYIDNISLNIAPTCFNIQNLSVNVISAFEAALSWNEVGKSTQWSVKVSSSQMEDMSETADMYDASVSACAANITGLTKNTTYYAYVRANCDESEWQSVSFTTPDVLTVPVYYEFLNGVNASGATGTGNGYIPQNWVGGNFNAPTNNSYKPGISTTAWATYPSGVEKNSLQLYGYLTTKKTTSGTSIGVNARASYVVLPKFANAKAKDVVMSFWGYVNGTSRTNSSFYYFDKLFIGVTNSQNPTSASDIKKVKTIEFTAGKTPQFFNIDMRELLTTDEDYIVLLAEVPESDESVFPTSNTTWYKYAQYLIDNLYIGLPESPRPITNLVATPTGDGAELSWTENGSATQWNVKIYDSSILNPDVEGAVPVFSQTVTSNPFTVTGLNMSRMYYAFVQAVVGSETGEWMNIGFKTTCSSITLPWFESFNYAGGTAMYDTNNKWLTPCISYANGLKAPTMPTASGTSFSSTCPDHVMGQDPTVAAAKYDSKTDPNHYVVQMYASSSATQKTVQLDLPEMPGNLNTLQLTFYLAPYSTNHCGVRVGVQTDTEFIPIQDFLGATGQWTECITNFSSLGDDVTGKIAIRADYDYFKNTEGYGFATSYTGGFVDDILVEQTPACAKITNVAVADVDSVSAVIRWTKATSETRWNLKVSSVELTDMTQTADVFDGVVENTPEKTLDGLNDLSVYYVYVQAVRPDQDCVGEWSSAASFKTLAKAKPLPYFNSFENEPEGSITNTDGQLIYVPDGFLTCGEENGMIFMYMQNGGKTLAEPFGTYGMHMKTTKDKANYLVLPPFQTDDVKKLQLEFYTNTAKLTTPDYNYFDVGVMYDPTDPSTYTSVLPAQKDSARRVYGYFSFANDSTLWMKHIVTFENYIPEDENKVGHYIAIRPKEAHAVSNGALSNGNFYLDDISVRLRDSEKLIEPFALWVSGRARQTAGSDSLTISWETVDATTDFRIQLLDNQTEQVVVDTVVTAATEAIIGALQPNKVYTAQVRAEKDAALSAWSDPITFRTTVTNLSAQALPYREDFEYPFMDNQTAPTSATGCGWTIVKTTGALSTTASYQKDGTVSLLLAANAQLMTPALAIDDWSQATISVDVQASTLYDTEFSIYLAETANADGVSGATLLKTITLVKNSDWNKVILPVKDYFTSVQTYPYIYITATRQIAIDNFLVTTDSSFPVENLSVNDYSDTWIAYSFDEYTEGVNEWTVEYGAAGFTPGEGTQKVLTATADTLTGLTPDTSYDIYVKSTSNNEWTGPLSVSLVKAAHAIPYYTDFEDDADNSLWTIDNTLGQKTYHNTFIFGDADKVDGTGEKALFVSDDGENYQYYKPDGFATVRARRTIEIDAPGSYSFYMRIKSSGIYDGDAPAVLLVPASANFTGGSSSGISTLSKNKISYVSDSEINNSYVIIPFNSTSGDNQRVFHTDGEWVEVVEKKDIVKAGTYQLYILWNWYMQGETGEPVAIDSIAIEDYECTESKNVRLTAVSGNSASFSWYGGKLKNFEVVVSPYKKLSNPFGIAAEDVVTHQTISEGANYTVENLQPNTDYAFYVRSICLEGPTEAFVEYDFTTICEAYSVPFTELFGETPECWTLSQGTYATSHAVETAQMKLDGTNDRYNYLSIPKNGYAILPLLDAPINDLDIKVDVWNVASVASYPISVGIVAAPNSMDDYETLYTYQMKNVNSTRGTYLHIDSEEFEFYTNTYTGSGNFLVIKGNSQAEVGVRSITITKLPECVPATQVEVTNIATTSATINWQTNGGSAWNIFYNDGIEEKSVYVTEQPYTLTNLQPGTDYTVAVQSICGENDYSNRSVITSFQTKCVAVALPLAEDFSSLPQLSTAQINCWENKTLTASVDQVFEGISIYDGNYDISAQSQTSSKYVSGSWHNADYWHNWMDNIDQICSWDNGGEYRKSTTKWFISPQCEITDSAQLVFDITYLQNAYAAGIIDPTKASNSRFFVLVTTDNAQTWKQTDAMEIDLTSYNKTPKKVNIDMSAYKDMTIRFALCHEINYTYSNNTFLFIDNLMLMEGSEVNFTDVICAGSDYNDNGFSIAAADLKIGQINEFEEVKGNTVRHLTLTVEPIESTTATVNMCEGDVYENNGLSYVSGGTFYENVFDEDGCLQQRYTTLVFNAKTITEMGEITLRLSELPYTDGIITIPVDATVGVIDTIVTASVEAGACTQYHYIIRITDSATDLSAVNEGSLQLNLMPNPAEAGAVCKLSGIEAHKIARIRIYNIAGALVNTLQLNEETIIAPVQSGVYTLVVDTSDANEYVGKLIVK